MSKHAPTAPEADFEAIRSRLEEEFERGNERPSEDAEDRFSLRRAEAERYWAVTAERPFLFRTGVWGRAWSQSLVPAKGFLRKLMRWYVEPLAAEQRRFNSSVLKLIDSLSERADTADGALDRLGVRLEELRPQIEVQERRASELEERLTRSERRQRAAAPPPAASPLTDPALPPPGQPVFPDYFAYESRMRGTTEHVREKQRAYVEYFRDAAPVVDLGCGRGEFLSLLRETGIEAKGIDVDTDMVAYARGEGLDVQQADAIQYLESVADSALGGIFAAQLVEHLPAATLIRLLELAVEKLRPGGVIVAETINPVSPFALRNYFADLTHAQPLVPETLELLAKQAGFSSVETQFLNEPDEKLEEPADPTIAANVRRLNELLFAPLDYAIIARK